MNPLPIVALLLLSQRNGAAPARVPGYQSVGEVREGLRRAADILEKIERLQQMGGALPSGRALLNAPENSPLEDRDPYVMSPMPPRQYQEADGLSPDFLQMMQTFGPILKTWMQSRDG